jgi:hypothetical protein
MNPADDHKVLPLLVADGEFEEERQTNNKTAQAAVVILRRHELRYFTLDTKQQKRNLAEAFAREDKPVYGRAPSVPRNHSGVDRPQRRVVSQFEEASLGAG